MANRNSLTMGIFDGVHIGHRRLIEKTKEVMEKGAQTILLTFDYPASYYLSNESFSGLIYTPQKRKAIIQSLGIDKVEFLDFNQFHTKTPLEFIQHVYERYQPSELTVGFNFHFGKDKVGNAELLRDLGHRFGFRTNIVSAVNCGGHRVSSSLIRYYLKNGDIQKANEILKRPYSVEGKVYADQGIGKKIGFPTANLFREGHDMLVPSFGVYLAYTPQLGFGLMNIGNRPTVSDQGKVHYEIHYLKGTHHLYGMSVVCYLIDFIRMEERFSSINELVSQIKQDRMKALEKIDTLNLEEEGWKYEVE